MFVADGMDAIDVGEVFILMVSTRVLVYPIVVFNGSLNTRLSSGYVLILNSCSNGLLSSVILWLNALT